MPHRKRCLVRVSNKWSFRKVRLNVWKRASIDWKLHEIQLLLSTEDPVVPDIGPEFSSDENGDGPAIAKVELERL